MKNQLKKILKMKKLFNIGILGAIMVLLFASCKKYLDINDNPNAATSSKPELVLSNALTATAGLANTYNSMGAQLGGYMANAGGYGGFGASVTYDFGTGNYAGCWDNTYDNLADYQWIINNTEGKSLYAYYNAAAKIMKAFDVQLLVDTYNDIPYTDAIKEISNLTPKYDDAKTVYTSIYALLDDAIKVINTAKNGTAEVKDLGSSDVLFGGTMDDWKKLANTLKLRIAIRGKAGGLTFSNTYDNVGFLTKDAIINPGYQKASGKQNPFYNTWAYTYTDAAGNRAWMPSKFVYAFYSGNKISDDYRLYAVFNTGAGASTAPPTNQLGYESTSVAAAPAAGSWTVTYNESLDNNIGVMKGPGAGVPILTASESYFLQAEASLTGGLGVVTPAQTSFYNGILASFKYLWARKDGSDAAEDPNWWGAAYTDLFGAYLSDNTGNYLVDYPAAASDAQRLEAIITQKYIALNMINCDQAWNDFRRTGYPKITNGSTNAVLSFASTQSISTRADKLISRVMYPTSEVSYNNSNMPKNITVFTSRIFWDPN